LTPTSCVLAGATQRTSAQTSAMRSYAVYVRPQCQLASDRVLTIVQASSQATSLATDMQT
jgi:hypothetical protein